jgi:hypothetical protein
VLLAPGNSGELLVISANEDFAFEIADSIYSFFPEPNGRYRAAVDERNRINPKLAAQQPSAGRANLPQCTS